MVDDYSARESEERSLLRSTDLDQTTMPNDDDGNGEDMAYLNSHTTDHSNGVILARNASSGGEGAPYRVYKRRWFGLTQLVLLNIIVSWDVGKIQPFAVE